MHKSKNKEPESKDGSTVKLLICRIKKLIREKNPIVLCIKRPKVLISALEYLDSLVEMDILKQSVTETVYSFLLSSYRSLKEDTTALRFDSRELHFCNYGPPGTGKTSVSKIIAKIFYGVGIDYDFEDEVDEDPVPSNFSFINEQITQLLTQTTFASKEFKALSDKIKGQTFVKSVSRRQSPSMLPPSLARAAFVSPTISWTPDENLKILGASIKAINISVSDIKIFIDGPNILPSDDEDESEDEKFDEKFDKNDDPNVEEDVYCVVCGKNELVAKFIGQTSGQCHDFLMKHRGKTVIIEEAYSLCMGGQEKDSYGAEALTIINRFMDESRSIIIGFNGYKNLLNRTIFKVQPGLKSRVSKFYNVVGYSSSGLVKIFKTQLESVKMKLSDTVDIESIFKENILKFPAYGRDTFRLARTCRDVHTNSIVKLIFDVKDDEEIEINYVVDENILLKSVSRYIEMSFREEEEVCV